jgi:hypothetical protein
MTADSENTPPTSERPRWSASEAAKRCGVGRSTILRALDSGRLPGAVKTEQGWSIGVEDLLAAGFHPGRSTPDRDTSGVTHEQDRTESEQESLRVRVQELESALATAEVRREVAEQIAAERALRVDDLRRTLAMLTEGRSNQAPANAGVPESNVPPSVPRRGPLERLVGRFGL